MGSAAILRAVAKHQIQPDGIILELPFISLLDSAKTRLRSYNLPPTPMAELMVFWGGVQHGFNGFDHRPITDAKAVQCPVLILAGDKDKTISIEKVKKLAKNIKTLHNLIIFSEAGHELLVRNNTQLWKKSIQFFMKTISEKQ
jgi:alpha-beta hydrolase superfamily lysophospholipase